MLGVDRVHQLRVVYVAGQGLDVGQLFLKAGRLLILGLAEGRARGRPFAVGPDLVLTGLLQLLSQLLLALGRRRVGVVPAHGLLTVGLFLFGVGLVLGFGLVCQLLVVLPGLFLQLGRLGGSGTWLAAGQVLLPRRELDCELLLYQFGVHGLDHFGDDLVLLVHLLTVLFLDGSAILLGPARLL